MTQRILLIEDDPDTCTLLEGALRRLNYHVDAVGSAQAASEALASASYSVVMTDLGLPGKSGLQLCEEIIKVAPNVPVIVITGDTSTESAIEAIRRGAFDYLTKPIDGQLLGLSVARALHRARLHQEVERLKERTSSGKQRAGLLGDSAPMRAMRELIARVASSEASVLISGETGTGKELVAHAIHAQSARKDGPFVAINCAAVPASLLESELFGHAKGAFTDAKSARDGLFLKADGGTLFLDEIGDMPMEMQSKLLRALQERTVRPVGSNAEIPFNVRLVAATHQDLEHATEQRRFREDLFYRINVVTVDVPPLRERGGDILSLAANFLSAACAHAERAPVSLSPQVAERLIAYDWPGNVRELENCMERVAALARYQSATVLDLPEHLRGTPNSACTTGSARDEEIITLEELERRHILATLARVQGNKSRAAELIGLDRRTLYRKLDAYRRSENGAPASSANDEAVQPALSV
jgi:two-component system response regulator HydG